MYPFVVTVESIAGGTVEEVCEQVVKFARELKCLVRTKINDVEITVSESMTGKHVYEQWLAGLEKHET